MRVIGPDGPTAWSKFIAFSPDKETMAAGSADGAIRLWRISDCSLVRTFGSRRCRLDGLAYSPDGQLLASVGEGVFRLWNLQSGALQYEYTFTPGKWLAQPVFSPNGQMIAIAGGETAYVWHLGDAVFVESPQKHRGGVNGLSFSPDGQGLLSSGIDNTVQLWSTKERSRQWVIGGHCTAFKTWAISTDGQTIADGREDGKIRIWRIRDGALMTTLHCHDHYVEGMALSPDNRYLVSMGDPSAMRVWSVRDGRQVTSIENLVRPSKPTFLPDSQHVIFLKPFSLCTWSLTDEALGEISFDSATLFYSVSAQGMVAVGMENGYISLVNPVGGVPVGVLQVQHRPLGGLALSPDGSLLAAADKEEVRVWQTADRTLLSALKDHHLPVSLAFSPDGRILATGSFDGDLRLWNARDGTLLRSLGVRNHDPAFVPAGDILISRSFGGAVHFWGIGEK
jgi:WD40 repeat protein